MIKQFGIYRVVNHFSKNRCNKSMDQTIEASESVLTNQNIMQAKRLNVNTSWQAHACCWWFDVKFHLSDTDSDAYSHLKSPYNDTFGWQHHYIIVMLYMSCFSLSRSLAEFGHNHISPSWSSLLSAPPSTNYPSHRKVDAHWYKSNWFHAYEI